LKRSNAFPGQYLLYPWCHTVTKGATKTLKIDGLAPTDKDYPYHQIFSFITKGEPSGPAKKFIDFAASEKGVMIMKEKGMFPISK